MSKNNKKKESQLLFDNSIKNLFADNVQILPRNDDKTLLAFQQEISPGILTEAARILIDNEHAKNLIDKLCKNLNYSPKTEK